MPRQLDLLGHAGLEVEPEPSSSEPRLWKHLFHLVRDLEAMGTRSLFQYIVTTTTSPPEKLRSDTWLATTLGG